MGKELSLKYCECIDSWGDLTGETLSGKTDSGTDIYFSVYDLCECPEDATVTRDLFGAADYLDALRLGMKLAEEGYTDIYLEEEKDAEE